MPSTTSSSRSLIALSALALTCTTTALPILGAPPFASTPPHTMPGAKAHPPSVKGPDSDHPMFLPDSPNTEDSGFNTGIIIAVLMLGIAGLCAGAAIGIPDPAPPPGNIGTPRRESVRTLTVPIRILKPGMEVRGDQ
ncbi:hypothetical protein CC86DRAFT_464780 [Ophiobolus disseminans]|uniref:Uncharacterized protein n=1 Tax=Ophiobolus disseminans TaxID=1469910 RepID=A0A6A7A910_9PLEO|nr:hypothetical protein CC86DRAFT_464780 [Ophiobolus disseminans]